MDWCVLKLYGWKSRLIWWVNFICSSTNFSKAFIIINVRATSLSQRVVLCVGSGGIVIYFEGMGILLCLWDSVFMLSLRTAAHLFFNYIFVFLALVVFTYSRQEMGRERNQEDEQRFHNRELNPGQLLWGVEAALPLHNTAPKYFLSCQWRCLKNSNWTCVVLKWSLPSGKVWIVQSELQKMGRFPGLTHCLELECFELFNF